MKTVLRSLLLLLPFTTVHVEAMAEEAPSYTLTSNVNLVSNYRFRGIDQTWGKPALQGGFDLATASGWYAGVWASNVSGNSYPGGNLELDYYGGYNGKINDELGYTVGGYGYWYPGASYARASCPSAAFSSPCSLPTKHFNTFEINAGATWKWLSYKLSVSMGDYFGAHPSTGYTDGTRGTLYHDLTASYPLTDNLSLSAHVGHTAVKAKYGNISASYTDYRIALARSFAGGWTLTGALVGADNNRFFRPPVGGLSAGNDQTRALNRAALVAQIGRTF